MDHRHKLWNRKSYWTKRLTKCETEIADILSRAYRHDKTLRPRHIREVNNRLLVLGAYGERLRQELAEAGCTSELLAKVGDNLQDIQDLSNGLARAAKKILGFELTSLRPYTNSQATSIVSKNSAVQKALTMYTEASEDEIPEDAVGSLRKRRTNGPQEQ